MVSAPSSAPPARNGVGDPCTGARSQGPARGPTDDAGRRAAPVHPPGRPQAQASSSPTGGSFLEPPGRVVPHQVKTVTRHRDWRWPSRAIRPRGRDQRGSRPTTAAGRGLAVGDPAEHQLGLPPRPPFQRRSTGERQAALKRGQRLLNSSRRLAFRHPAGRVPSTPGHQVVDESGTGRGAQPPATAVVYKLHSVF